MIDVTDEQMKIIRAILALWVPTAEVRVFGSRASGPARKHSDLDLAVAADQKIDFSTMNRLREAFEDSELPFRVDVLDWNAISDSFRKTIADQCVVLRMEQKNNGSC
jgi:predicted nucleotidyltransferase